jgi:7-cyano-7-deazaguanine synthase
LLDRHHDVSALFIDYGQAPAEHERLAAGAIAKHFDVQLLTISVTGGRSFSDGELPGRNAFLIATALFFGAPQQNFIAIGIHAGTPPVSCHAR